MIKLAEDMVTCTVFPMDGEEGNPLKIRIFVSQSAMNKIEDISDNGVTQENSVYIGGISAKVDVLRELKDNWRYKLEFPVFVDAGKDKEGNKLVNARIVKMESVEFYNLKNNVDYANGESDNVEIRVFSYSKIDISE